MTEPISRAPNHSDFGPPSFAQPPTSMPLPSSTNNTSSFTNNAPVYAFAPANPPSQENNVVPYTPFTHNAPFAPVGPPPQTFQCMSNQIMNAYEQPPSNPGILAIENGPQTESGYFPMNQPQMTSVQPQYAQPPPPTHINTTPAFSLTPPRDSPVSSIATPEYTEKLSMHLLQGQSQESPQSVRQVDGLQQAMQNLVNFEHMCEPVESSMKLTMVKEEETKTPSNKSQGLPPVQVAWHLGTRVSLADIKANGTPREAPDREVMRANAFNPATLQAGMTVVYRDPVSNQAPPLQTSFGYNAYGGAY